MSPYDPDSEFSISALQRLQNAGFNFAPSLLNHYKFMDHAKKMPEYDVPAETEEPLRIIVDNWLDAVGRPSTWRSLLEILQELSLGEMSQQIENFLSCGKYSSTRQNEKREYLTPYVETLSGKVT